MNADPFDLARAEAMLRGYDCRWGDEMADRYVVLAVEAEFRAPLINPETGAASRTWQRGGKIDAIAHDCQESRDVIVEHKTASEDIGPGTPYWRKLRMDGQVSGYFLGADAIGFPAEACLYDVLGKLSIRPYKATPAEDRKFKKDGTLYANQRAEDETPEEFRARCIDAICLEPDSYYRRGEVVRLAAESEEALFDDWQTAQQIHESSRRGRFPRNPDACMKWGRACDYFDVCAGEASISDAFRFRQSAHVSPELTADGGLPVLSASRLRAARSCQRLHKFQYLDGIRPIAEADSLRFGSLIHKGLEAWWKAPNGERLEAALAAITTQPEGAHRAA
jgi:hypothetical protein